MSRGSAWGRPVGVWGSLQFLILVGGEIMRREVRDAARCGTRGETGCIIRNGLTGAGKDRERDVGGRTRGHD